MPIETALQGKPYYYGLLIGLALAIICVVATHYLWIVNIDKEIQSSNQKLDDLQKKIAAGQAAQKKLPQFREEVSRLELELEKLRRILPSTRNTEEIIKKIKALVDQGDFELLSMTFPKLASGGSEPFVEWPISIKVNGGYHNLAILFNKLSNFSRIMDVDTCTITAMPDQTTRSISADFVAKTFVYMEPKEPEKTEETPKAKPAGGKGGAGE
jgi:type IV pilus assembly protein PilO